MAKSPRRRTFSREFKIEAIRAVADGHKTIRQVARELGIRGDLIHRWRRELEAGSGEFESGRSEVVSQDEEIRRLRQELARVTEERDILKKATAFFAKESR
jgi:transposase